LFKKKSLKTSKEYFFGKKLGSTFFHARISRCGKGRVSDFLGQKGADFLFTSVTYGVAAAEVKKTCTQVNRKIPHEAPSISEIGKEEKSVFCIYALSSWNHIHMSSDYTCYVGSKFKRLWNLTAKSI
jgi:hypothetical protein